MIHAPGPEGKRGRRVGAARRDQREEEQRAVGEDAPPRLDEVVPEEIERRPVEPVVAAVGEVRLRHPRLRRVDPRSERTPTASATARGSGGALRRRRRAGSSPPRPESADRATRAPSQSERDHAAVVAHDRDAAEQAGREVAPRGRSRGSIRSRPSCGASARNDAERPRTSPSCCGSGAPSGTGSECRTRRASRGPPRVREATPRAERKSNMQQHEERRERRHQEQRRDRRDRAELELPAVLAREPVEALAVRVTACRTTCRPAPPLRASAAFERSSSALQHRAEREQRRRRDHRRPDVVVDVGSGRPCPKMSLWSSW